MSGLHATVADERDAEAAPGDAQAPYAPERSSSSVSDAPTTPEQHAFLAAAVLRKVHALLAPSDKEKRYTPVIFARDVTLGIIVGMVLISCGVLLDHMNVIHLQSAHHLRKAAGWVLDDPETIATLQESAELTFLGMEEYQSNWGELDLLRERLREHEATLEELPQTVEDHRKELDALKVEYDRLYNHPLLELNKYCGKCVWGMGMTCDQRVVFLEHTYQTNRIIAMKNALLHESCKKKE